MKPEKAATNPVKKHDSTKKPKKPISKRVQGLLLQNGTDGWLDSGQSGRPQTQSQKGPRALFHHDPSLPISFKIAFVFPSGIVNR